MAYHDYEYLMLVNRVLSQGHQKSDRTGTGTLSTFGQQLKFDLSDGSIPLLTTKKMHLKSVIYEILWYLRGESNIAYLNQNGVTIWDEWANEDGDLGPVYGKQWRQWEVDGVKGPTYIDQIAQVIKLLQTNPDSRRMVVTNWNVGQLDDMALMPCHYAFQLWTRPLSFAERKDRHHLYTSVSHGDTSDIELEKAFNMDGVPKYSLSLEVTQRSCDVGLGVPFNIVQYGILLRMFAQVVNMVPGELVWSGGDVHIYNNHVEALREQVTRSPKQSPRLEFARDIKDIDDFKFEDFQIVGYESHPTIKMEVSV